jgi:hypothetical protein
LFGKKSEGKKHSLGLFTLNIALECSIVAVVIFEIKASDLVVRVLKLKHKDR